MFAHPKTKTLRKLLISFVVFAPLSLHLAGQTIPPRNPPKIYTPIKWNQYTSRVGLWRTDNSFQSTIRLSNQLAVAPITATVTIFMADGARYELPPVSIRASSVATVSVNSALASMPAEIAPHISQFGSASVSYRYDWQGVVYATMSILDIPRSLQYTFPFMFPMNAAMPAMASEASSISTVMEALTWSYSQDSVSFFSFANASQRTVNVALARLNSAGQVSRTDNFAVPAMNTVLRVVPQGSGDSGGAGTPASVRISFNADADSLSIAAGVEDVKHGYSANVPMAELPSGGATASATFAAASAGLMVGKADTMMGFPAGLRFQPYAYFHNITEMPVTVNAAVYYGTPISQRQTLPDFVVLPHQSVSMSSLPVYRTSTDQ